MRESTIKSANFWTKHFAENNIDYSCDGKTVVRCHDEKANANEYIEGTYSFISKLKDNAYYRYTAK